MVKLLVNIMVYKLVLIKACFEPLRYYFFLKYRSIVNKKTEFFIHVSRSIASHFDWMLASIVFRLHKFC